MRDGDDAVTTRHAAREYHARHCLHRWRMATGGAVKTTSLLLAFALCTLATRAGAQVEAREQSGDVAACVADHKLVQTTREAGHYLESRDGAARCAQSSCPQLIREDCAAWYVDGA